MSLFTQVNHHHKNGEFKNNLVSVNNDYIEIDESLIWVNRSDIDVEVTFESVFSTTQVIYSKGIFANAASGLVFLRRDTSINGGTIIISDISNANNLTISVNNFINGINTVRIKDLEVYVNDVLLTTMAEATCNINSIYQSRVGTYSYGLSSFLNGAVYSFSIGSELFTLDEKSGYRLYGDQGSFGTRVTSNAGGLTYINSTMIEKL